MRSLRASLACLGLLASVVSRAAAQDRRPEPPPVADGRLAPGRLAGDGIVVGLEYAVLDNLPLVRGMAAAFAETGLTGMKVYPEAVQWGQMQKGPDRPIDFTRLDWFVREYQDQGFTELTLALKSHSAWASRHVPLVGKDTNPTPKAEHRAAFENWIGSIVERYDGDGKEDMPGLRWPVRWVEIGSEFSSYEPEPVEEYLEMLALAYRAAHRASADVRIGHAAFLITPVNLDVADPADYERAWAAIDHPDKHHGLADQRAVLDHPESFDFVNIHSLGCPYEIEYAMKWLRYEMGRRGYARPVVVSDTTPTSYIGWGPATIAKGRKLGLIAAPATEADRGRLAVFFRKLVGKDEATLAWTRGFVAADHVQRTVIAAEQGVRLINLSFTGDLTLLTLPVFQAGAGIGAWGGALRMETPAGKVAERYPLFHAIRQMMGQIQGYDAIERVNLAETGARVYRVTRGGKSFWIAWLNSGKALLPEDGQPSLAVKLSTGLSSAVIEPVITEMGRSKAERRSVTAEGGALPLTLTHTPVYVLPE